MKKSPAGNEGSLLGLTWKKWFLNVLNSDAWRKTATSPQKRWLQPRRAVLGRRGASCRTGRKGRKGACCKARRERHVRPAGGAACASCPSDLAQPPVRGCLGEQRKARRADTAVSGHTDAWRSPESYSFLNTQKTMASLCSQWLQCEPLPPTMAPFNPPPWAIAPSLTACVRGAPGIKGGVSRFSEHFASIHQRRDKSNSLLHLGQGRGWGLHHPHQMKLSWVGGPHCVQGWLCKHGSWLFLPPTKDICMKMARFCSLRRAKGNLLVGSGTGAKGEKGSQVKTKKVSRRS